MGKYFPGSHTGANGALTVGQNGGQFDYAAWKADYDAKQAAYMAANPQTAGGMTAPNGPLPPGINPAQLPALNAQIAQYEAMLPNDLQGLAAEYQTLLNNPMPGDPAYTLFLDRVKRKMLALQGNNPGMGNNLPGQGYAGPKGF